MIRPGIPVKTEVAVIARPVREQAKVSGARKVEISERTPGA